jgi:transposase
MTTLNNQKPGIQNEPAVAEKTSYSEEFKAKVIEVYQSGMYPTAAECAKAYQINPNTFYQWINRSRKKSTDPETNAELSELRKELSRLKQENQILKKAAIYFASQAQ